MTCNNKLLTWVYLVQFPVSCVMCVGVCVCMVCVHVCVWVGVCVGHAIQQIAYLGVSGTVSSLLCACVCVCVGVSMCVCVCVCMCGCIQCTLISSCEHL